jgi:hemoglobin
METLYEKLGGEPAIDATQVNPILPMHSHSSSRVCMCSVEKFYDLVLANPVLSPFFVSTNMERQRLMQKSFLNHVFGGKPYNGKGMRAAHAKLHLEDKHFDEVLAMLRKALASLGVKEDLIKQVIATAETTREEVLGRPAK